jgi:hypothetical protein
MRIAATMLLLVAFVGCPRAEDRAMKRQVSREELVGTWRLDEAGMVGLRDAGYKTHLRNEDHTLDLQGDGSCRIRTFRHPQSLDPAPLYVDSPCHWRMTNLASQRVEVVLPTGVPETFQVAEEGGHLLLWQYLDDPDPWKYVEFVRASGK